VDGIAFDVAGDGYVMSFMTFEGVGVVDGENFLIAIRYHDQFRTLLDTLLGALGLVS
jgi:hypothetical protein